MLTQEGNREFRIERDFERFEFDDVADSEKNIDYYVFSEKFQAWIKADLNQIKRDYPQSYQELIYEINEAINNYCVECNSAERAV